MSRFGRFALVTIFVSGGDASEAGDRAALIDSLLSDGKRLSSPQVRRSDAALPLLRRAASLSEADNDSVRSARSNIELGSALVSVHQQGPAKVALERGIAQARKAGASGLEGDGLARLGALHVERGEFEEAQQALLASSRLALRANDYGLHLRAVNSLTALKRNTGDTRAAIELGRSGLRELDQHLANHDSVPTQVQFAIPYNLGRALMDNGDYGQGLALLERALTAAERSGSLPGVWHVLLDTAEWYKSEGDYGRAARYYARALEWATRIESRDPEALTRLGIASLRALRGDYAAAEADCRAALAILQTANFYQHIPRALVQLSRIQSLGGKPAEALATVESVLIMTKERENPLDLALARLEMARQDESAGKADSARLNFETVLRVARANGLRTVETSALTGLARLAQNRGDPGQALALYEQSASVIDTIRATIPSFDARTAYAEANHSTYGGLFTASLNLYRGHPSDANALRVLMNIERERAHATRDAVAQSDVPTASKAEVHRYEGQIARLQTQLWSSELPAGRRIDLVEQLDDAERQLTLLQPQGGSSTVVGPAIRVLRDALEPGEALIEYAIFGPSAVAVVVTRSRVDIVPLKVEHLSSRIDFFNGMLAEGRIDEALGAGRPLSRQIVAEPLRIAGSAKRIIIAAAGDLAGLPFAALPDPEKPDAPLIRRLEVAYVPSLAALALSRRRTTAARTAVLVIANPEIPRGRKDPRTGLPMEFAALLHSRKEVETVTKIARPGTVLSEAAASEASLKRQPLRDFQLIHFATHALLDPVDSRRSAIVLASGDQNEDGLLQPRDIYPLRMPGALVVMSGCETAAGRPSASEGLLSLGRAFAYAGARSVVGTLWKVEDRAAAEFAGELYRDLAKHNSVSAALRNAQLRSGRGGYGNAASWAAWTVYGDPSLQILSEPARPAISAKTALALLAFLLATALTLIVVRRHAVVSKD